MGAHARKKRGGDGHMQSGPSSCSMSTEKKMLTNVEKYFHALSNYFYPIYANMRLKLNELYSCCQNRKKCNPDNVSGPVRTYWNAIFCKWNRNRKKGKKKDEKISFSRISID